MARSYGVMKLNSLDAGDEEARLRMTKRDLALEMIRMKRMSPITDLSTGITYASISELARDRNKSPQTMYKIVHSRSNRMHYDFEPYYQPYFDLKECNTVDEYVMHFIRKNYFELMKCHLKELTYATVKDSIDMREWFDGLPMLEIRGDEIWDVFDPKRPERVCFVSDLGEEPEDEEDDKSKKNKSKNKY